MLTTATILIFAAGFFAARAIARAWARSVEQGR
jgi:hypothetical protein